MPSVFPVDEVLNPQLIAEAALPRWVAKACSDQDFVAVVSDGQIVLLQREVVAAELRRHWSSLALRLQQPAAAGCCWVLSVPPVCLDAVLGLDVDLRRMDGAPMILWLRPFDCAVDVSWS